MAWEFSFLLSPNYVGVFSFSFEVCWWFQNPPTYWKRATLNSSANIIVTGKNFRKQIILDSKVAGLQVHDDFKEIIFFHGLFLDYTPPPPHYQPYPHHVIYYHHHYLSLGFVRPVFFSLLWSSNFIFGKIYMNQGKYIWNI